MSTPVSPAFPTPTALHHEPSDPPAPEKTAPLQVPLAPTQKRRASITHGLDAAGAVGVSARAAAHKGQSEPVLKAPRLPAKITDPQHGRTVTIGKSTRLGDLVRSIDVSGLSEKDARALTAAFLLDRYGPAGPAPGTRVTLPQRDVLLSWHASSPFRLIDQSDGESWAKKDLSIDQCRKTGDSHLWRMQHATEKIDKLLSSDWRQTNSVSNVILTNDGSEVRALERARWGELLGMSELLPVPRDIDDWLSARYDLPGAAKSKEHRQKIAELVAAHVEGVLRHEQSPTGIAIIDWIVHAFEKLFEKPGELAAIGLQNAEQLRHLTPQQAMILAEQIASELIEYKESAAAQDVNGNSTPEAAAEEAVLDAKPIEEFFHVKDGICRHYAQVAVVVFDVLKWLQTPPSQLTNLYAQKAGGELAEHGGHSWVAFALVEPGAKVTMGQIDPTFNDAGVDNRSRNKDYTFGEKTRRAQDGLRFEYLRRDVMPASVYVDLVVDYYCGGLVAEPGMLSLPMIQARGGTERLLAIIGKVPEWAQYACFAALDADAQNELVALAVAKKVPLDFSVPSEPLYGP